MKKLLPVLLMLGAFALIFQFFVNLFLQEHKVVYSVKTKNHSYDVEESFLQKKENSYYDFKIKDENKNLYYLSYEKDMNKQDHVILDIESFYTKKLQCILPIYKRNYYGDIACRYQGKQVSSSYLKQNNIAEGELVFSELKSKGYKNVAWEENNSTTKKNTIEVYKKNIPQNYIFTIWNYKGLYLIQNSDVLTKEFLEKDSYENKLSALANKYYVTVNTDMTSQQISQFYIYNVKDLGKQELDINDTISNHIFIHGSWNKNVYFTDLDSNKQFKIDAEAIKIEEVGNKEKGYYTVKNGNLTVVPAQKFNLETRFDAPIKNKKLNQAYGDIEIYKVQNYYYYKTKEGEVYKAEENDLTHPILLFSLPNLTEWKVKDFAMIVVAGDTLYFYNDEVGLKKIAKNHELIYNHENICDFTKK